MARYTGPKNRVSRRLGADVFDTRRSALEKRPYPPGQHGRGRIRETEYLAATGESVRLAASFGVATFPDDARDLTSLLALGDQALFSVKESGRDGIATAAGGDHASSLRSASAFERP